MVLLIDKLVQCTSVNSQIHTDCSINEAKYLTIISGDLLWAYSLDSKLGGPTG